MSNSKLSPLSLKSQTISPRYFGFWPGMQDPLDGRASIIDRSGKGRNLNVGANGTYSAVTATSKYASVVGAVAAQDKALATTDVLTWDMFAGQSMILALTMNAAIPGAVSQVFNARGGSGDVKGMALAVDAAGKPLIYVRDTVATFATNLPTDVICDGTDHTIIVMIDGTNKKAYGWKDGVAFSTLTSGQTITSISGSTQGNDPARFGASGDFVAASAPTWVNGQTLKLRNMHVMVMDYWPANYLTIVKELNSNIHRPLSAALLP